MGNREPYFTPCHQLDRLSTHNKSMSNRLTKLVKNSKQKIKQFRKDIKALKEEQKKEQKKAHQKERAPKKASDKMEEVVVHFSAISVAKSTLIVLGIILLSQFFAPIAEILLIFFLSILFAAALDPTVDALERRKIPRSVSVIGIFILLIALLIFFISQLIPLMAEQLVQMGQNIAELITKQEYDSPFLQKASDYINSAIQSIDLELILNKINESLNSITTQLKSFAGDTLGFILWIFNSILNFFLFLILTFFLVVDEKNVNNFFLSLFPSKHAHYIIDKMDAVKHKIGFWLRGQIILMITMFTISLIGFMLLGVDYALTLAMLTGIGELIPIVGALIAGIPAILVGLNTSTWLAFWVAIFILVSQQLEGNILVPMIMKKAVGLSPIIIILAMVIGGKTLGILGAIIAVPVTTALSIFVMDYTAKKK
jgi:predicted PurR-regulated permease PerM